MKQPCPSCQYQFNHTTAYGKLHKECIEALLSYFAKPINLQPQSAGIAIGSVRQTALVDQDTTGQKHQPNCI